MIRQEHREYSTVPAAVATAVAWATMAESPSVQPARDAQEHRHGLLKKQSAAPRPSPQPLLFLLEHDGTSCLVRPVCAMCLLQRGVTPFDKVGAPAVMSEASTPGPPAEFAIGAPPTAGISELSCPHDGLLSVSFRVVLACSDRKCANDDDCPDLQLHVPLATPVRSFHQHPDHRTEAHQKLPSLYRLTQLAPLCPLAIQCSCCGFRARLQCTVGHSKEGAGLRTAASGVRSCTNGVPRVLPGVS